MKLMPGKSRKYSPSVETELKMRIIYVLDTADDSIMPTIEWIQKQDIYLVNFSSQKIARTLGSLIESGLVKKGKSKNLNKMVYRLTSKIEETKEEVEEPEVEMKSYYNNYELEDEINVSYSFCDDPEQCA